MRTTTAALDLSAPPVPISDDLNCFLRVWIDRRKLHSGEWLRLKRRDPVAALALLELHAAAQALPGCGLDDDDDALSHILGMDDLAWAVHGPVIRKHLVRFENGLLYVPLFLDDTRAAYEVKELRRRRTERAREAKAAKAAEAKAAKAAAAGRGQSGDARPASATPEPLPTAAPAPTSSGPGTTPSVGQVRSESLPVASPPQGGGMLREGGEGETQAVAEAAQAVREAEAEVEREQRALAAALRDVPADEAKWVNMDRDKVASRRRWLAEAEAGLAVAEARLAAARAEGGGGAGNGGGDG